MPSQRTTPELPACYAMVHDGLEDIAAEEIAQALSDGRRVELRGFGVFSVKVRSSRTGRNPRTGQPVSVGQKRAPFFRTGKELRERLNNGLMV